MSIFKGKREEEKKVFIDSYIGFKSSKSDTNKQVAPFTRIRFKLEMLARQQGCTVDDVVKGLQYMYNDSVKRTAQKVGSNDFISADFSNVDPDNVVDDVVEDLFTCSNVAGAVKNVKNDKEKNDKEVSKDTVEQKSDKKVIDNNNSVVSNSSE